MIHGMICRFVRCNFAKARLCVQEPRGRTKSSKLRTKAAALSLFVLGGVYSSGAAAGDVPGFQQPVRLQAVEQGVPKFIESLFSQISVPVKVESSILGTVNGAFSGTAEEVFAQISQAFNVYLYYDTSAAYVYSSEEMQSVILPLTHRAASRVAESALKMGFIDQRNYVTPIEGGGLMVNGSARFTEQIEALASASREQVKSIKPKVSPVEFRLFRLKYAWADDVDLNVGGRNVKVPGVATLLRTLILDDGSLPLASGVSVRRDALRLAKLKGSDQSTVESDDQETVALEKVSRQPSDSQFSIVAQPQLNAVAIRDTADRMPIYEQLIASLDVEPEMVEIEATIIDINVDRVRELGINWRLQDDGGSEFLFGNGTSSDQLLQPGEIITPQGQGGVLSLVLGDSTQFFSRVKALEAEGAASVVSKPHVLTLSNVEAVLGSTTEFFVRVEGTEEVDLFKVPVGTVLRVTPHVYKKGINSGIKLLVNIEDGSAIPGSTVDNIPVVERSAISTQALIAEGASLLIGGMVRESSSQSEVRVPLLGSVPWIGRLFKSTRTSKVKTERLFMITPRTASSDPSNFDGKGPVLQGDAVDILSSSDRIDRAEILNVEKRTERLAAQIGQSSAAGFGEDPFSEQASEPGRTTLASLNDEEMTRKLLQVPQVPTDEEIIQSRELMQWHEVRDSTDADDVIVFEEVRTSLNYSADTLIEEKLVETAAAFSDEDLYPVTVVPAGVVIVDNPAAVSKVNAAHPKVYVAPRNKPSSIRLVTPQKLNSPVNNQTTVDELAAGIASDLKARRSGDALQKINQLKKLAPDHEYSINGEGYIASLKDYLEPNPLDL